MIPVSGTINGSIHDEGVHLATSDIHFKRILVGIDFSKQAALALKTAIAIWRDLRLRDLPRQCCAIFCVWKGEAAGTTGDD